MPIWLQNQIRRAFHEKNHVQVKMLNQCWFYYWNNESVHY
ncbi:cortex morphogenetic protein CmpA [Peribacillus loiseleuriae]|uniref:Cortex morphogenetic protein CmpA n=1 Tax=Peribacillus huizhouensis TaxID=1501239 RepID=A0ABR6CWC9_9BACI|nr:MULTISPECIES: cortex morphogenetic protein CmpA [Bacillaceae]MBA9029240.1 hypothetical protein [Peribacillus huizhouensis]